MGIGTLIISRVRKMGEMGPCGLPQIKEKAHVPFKQAVISSSTHCVDICSVARLSFSSLGELGNPY
jgi:hypothetical protein